MFRPFIIVKNTQSKDDEHFLELVTMVVRCKIKLHLIYIYIVCPKYTRTNKIIFYFKRIMLRQSCFIQNTLHMLLCTSPIFVSIAQNIPQSLKMLNFSFCVWCCLCHSSAARAWLFCILGIKRSCIWLYLVNRVVKRRDRILGHEPTDLHTQMSSSSWWSIHPSSFDTQLS